MEVVLIDLFTVPEAARAAFLEQTNIARNVVKTLPGFVEGAIYERQGTGAEFAVLTVVVWASEAAFEQAKATVAETYRQIGFNPQATMQALNVELVRATYQRTRY